MSEEIQNVPFKGALTIRQIVAYTVAIGASIVTVVALYFNIIGRIHDAQTVSEDNNNILQEIRTDRKDDARMYNVRITDIENRQRADNIRITILETQLNK